MFTTFRPNVTIDLPLFYQTVLILIEESLALTKCIAKKLPMTTHFCVVAVVLCSPDPEPYMRGNAMAVVLTILYQLWPMNRLTRLFCSALHSWDVCFVRHCTVGTSGLGFTTSGKKNAGP
jgi:hypothetical protein